MTEKETGGPAFPCLDSNANGHEGLTIRDYFAAKAMQGLISAENWTGYIRKTAEEAYQMADAMLKEREV